MPGELRKKLRIALAFISYELLIFGLALIFSDDLVSGKIPVPVAAKFLGIAIFLHVAVAWLELKSWKKQFQKQSGYLR